MSKHEEKLSFQLKFYQLSFVREYRFAAIATGGTGRGSRQRLKDAGLKDWRFDFAFPDLKLAVEVDGGIYTNGRHNRPKGFQEDLIKIGEAQKLLWTVYRCTDAMVNSGLAIDTIKKLIALAEQQIRPQSE